MIAFPVGRQVRATGAALPAKLRCAGVNCQTQDRLVWDAALLLSWRRASKITPAGSKTMSKGRR